MECILLRFPTNVIGFSLEETVNIENTLISNLNDVDRTSDCEVRWASKTRHPDEILLAVNLFYFPNEITWKFVKNCKQITDPHY